MSVTPLTGQFRNSASYLLMRAKAKLKSLTNYAVVIGDGTKSSWTTNLPAGMRGFRPDSLSMRAQISLGPDITEDYSLDSRDEQVVTYTAPSGGVFTLNLETGAFTLETDSALPLGGEFQLTGDYLNVAQGDYLECKDLEVKRAGMPQKNYLDTGTFSGARPGAGSYWLEISGSAVVYPLSAWTRVVSSINVGTLPPAGASHTIDLYEVARIAGIHKTGLGLEPKSLSEAAAKFTITAWGSTFEDQGDGTLDGGVSASGTIDYSTGKITLLKESADPETSVVITQAVFCPPPTIYDLLAATHKWEFVEDASGTGKAYWRATPDICGGLSSGVRALIGGTECLASAEHRGDRAVASVSWSAEPGGLLMCEFNMLARSDGPRFDVGYRLNQTLLPSAEPSTHTTVDGSLTARPVLDDSAQDVLNASVYSGGYTCSTPFSDPERIETAWGSNTTAEIVAPSNTETDTEAEITLYDLKTSQYDYEGYQADNVVHELVQTWPCASFAGRYVKHELCCYISEMDPAEASNYIARTLKLCGLFGLPGDASPGRDRSAPVGRWEWGIGYDDAEDLATASLP